MIDEHSPDHKAGFVSIIGRPNVGKSTLMNQLVGAKVSIINSKAHTTRHRIFGILNGEDFQIEVDSQPGRGTEIRIDIPEVHPMPDSSVAPAEGPVSKAS